MLDVQGADDIGTALHYPKGSTMTMIRAAHYGETIRALMNDEHVLNMAIGLFNDDTPLIRDFGFTLACNAEYELRGGTISAHIGGVREAVCIILDAMIAAREAVN